MNLEQAKIGNKYLVKTIEGQDKQRLHLLEMGLIPDSIVEVVKRAPMGDPVELRLHGYELAIRNSQAKQVKVEPVKFTDESKPQINSQAKDNALQNNKSKNEVDPYNLCLDSFNCSTCKKYKNCNKSAKDTKSVSEIDLKKRFGQKNKNFLTKDTETTKKVDSIPETEHPGFGEPGRFHNKNDENPLPDEKTINFALVGNQNCGKTTLFNQLTGSNQHVGNFPGVTVDRKDGVIKGYPNTKITDLPGVYSLVPYSKEEEITLDMVLSDDVDCILNIVDATSIERSLYLTMQLMELNKPLVIALNMMDEFIENGGNIDINKLEQQLGVPIVPISAIKNQGIEELKDHAMHIAKYQELPEHRDFCENNDRGGAVHRAIHSIMHTIEDHCIRTNTPIRFAATMLAMRDQSTANRLDLDTNEKETIEHIVKQMEKEADLDAHSLIAEMRYKFITRVTDSSIRYADKSKSRDRSAKADKFLTGKWTAIPAFMVIMLVIFWLTFGVIGLFFQELLEGGIEFLSDISCQGLTALGVGEVVHSFVEDALFAGVGSVVSFLPIIIVMFFFLSLLEDSGYMARVAFVMDKLLRKIGLSGRSIVPMLIGFGCSVPAIMSTRTLPSKRDRKMTIFLTPYMSCSAKIPIYAFVASIFFPNNAALVMFLLYFLGIALGVILSFIFKGKGKPVPFIMELPNYRIPSAKNVLHLLWDKSKDFLQRAFSVILIATLVIWFLQHFSMTLTLVEDPQDSILAAISGALVPLFDPIGLGDWRLVTSLISGFLAKESVVATLSLLFGGAGNIALSITALSAASLLVFCLLYTPCVAAVASIRRELGIKYAVYVSLFQLVVAWVVSFITILLLGLVI